MDMPRTCHRERLDSLLRPNLFRALSDPVRLGLLSQLTNCCAPRTVTDVATSAPVSVSVVSRHLAQLRDAGILRAERAGKEVRYSVRWNDLAATLRALADAIEACCGQPEPCSTEERSGTTEGDDGKD